MAQTLETIIAINASVGSGFGEVGSTLTQLGAQVDAISDKLIGFGKDGLKIYEDYEVSMAKAKGALASTYGQDTKALNDAMKDLDDAANVWANTTRFHLEDVGEAINTAAHAKWDRDSIIANMPEAMELANAGAMDLSDAVKYLVTAQNSLDIPNDDLGRFIDLWAYAASRSVGDIDTFGQTLNALGSVGRFTDDPEELFAMIGMMHDMGTEGSAAATLLRTTWMRLLAPSGVGGMVLEHLGATDEEIKSIREDARLLSTLNFLEGYGFSAYEANGQAKPLIQTFTELRDVLAAISGGYEKIGKNQQALEILNVLFGIRGMKGALNIFEGLDEGIDLFLDMKTGAADGFGEYYSSTMMDTLWGQTMLWESKVEALKERTGETLAAQVEPILETLGGIVESFTNLDDSKFNALVSGLEVLALAGPGLMMTGAAFRFIAYALTPAGGIGLSLIALTAAAAAINELEKADFADKFGEMHLDPTEVQNYVQKLGQDFKDANADVQGFTTAIEQCVTTYKEKSAELSSSLLETMLTETEIKKDSKEYDKLMSLGEDMLNAVKEGINNNKAATQEGITNTFSTSDKIDSPIFAQIMAVIEQGFRDDIDTAESLGTQLRKALLSAFEDGHLTQDELDKINGPMDEMEKALAQQQDRAHYLERQRILRKARTLGLDAIREASSIAEAERDAELETLLSQQDADYYDLAAFYDSAIENGWMVPNTDGTEGEHAATEADKAAALAELKANQEAEQYAWSARFNDYLAGVWTAGIASSELSGAWDALNTLARSVQENNGYIDLQASNAYDALVTPEQTAQAVQYLDQMIGALGGYDMVQGYADYYERQGEAAKAQQMRNLLVMSDIFSSSGFAYPQIGAVNGQYTSELHLDVSDGTEAMDEELAQMEMQAEESNITVPVKTAPAESILPSPDELYAEYGIDRGGTLQPVDLRLPLAGGPYDQQLIDQGVTVSVDGDTQELEAVIDGCDGQTLMQYVSGDATDLAMSIRDQDGQTLREYVTGDASQLATLLSSYNGRTIVVNIQGRKMFASGGRATEPSVFGEAGAEWAIPEKHNDNTAALLDAARSASGFSWEELMTKNHSADGRSAQITIVYSPTIYANDVSGIDDALAKDKAQLEKWFKEKQLREEMEVYA